MSRPPTPPPAAAMAHTPGDAPSPADITDLHEFLCDLEGVIDGQIYDDMLRDGFDPAPDYEFSVHLRHDMIRAIGRWANRTHFWRKAMHNDLPPPSVLQALETLIDAASRKDSEKYLGRALFEARAALALATAGGEG